MVQNDLEPTYRRRHTLTKSKVAEHSTIGTSWQEGMSDRFMFASSFIGSIRCRLTTADELKSMTPLQPGKINDEYSS